MLLNEKLSNRTKRGEANLTISSFAHLMATLGKDPQDLFKPKK